MSSAPVVRTLPEGGGAFLIDKPDGISSFGAVNRLKGALRANLGVKRSRDLPKIGHGGTLDPFATGLLVVLVGEGVKLSRYFLDSQKAYDFTMRFGETNLAGDLTEPVTERSDHLPASIEEIRRAAAEMSASVYHQTPPMHSAKKKDGKRLYELARKGIEIEREAIPCTLYSLEVTSYPRPQAKASVRCSSGTYVRTLAQDLAIRLGSVALLDTLRRTASGAFRLEDALPLDEVAKAFGEGKSAEEFSCWMPLSRLLHGMPRAEATQAQAHALLHGQQDDLAELVRHANFPAEGSTNPQFDSHLAVFHEERLIAVAKREAGGWQLERVFNVT